MRLRIAKKIVRRITNEETNHTYRVDQVRTAFRMLGEPLIDVARQKAPEQLPYLEIDPIVSLNHRRVPSPPFGESAAR